MTIKDMENLADLRHRDRVPLPAFSFIDAVNSSTFRLEAFPDNSSVRIKLTVLVGDWAATLMITAAWTGARWGELTGLRRPNLHLDDAAIVIDRHTGALHEVNGRLELGPPKTAESARTITLPPFLVHLLRTHLDSHDHPHVFVTADGELLRRSNFARRTMRPAADGNHHRTRVHPILPRLVFHGFRHSHKTWLIADSIPDVAQAPRLGHRIPTEVAAVPHSSIPNNRASFAGDLPR